jgi:signal peptidase II|tara:strand:- start:57 stop:557 length:501 start_codon:yes stop_codon:yes gene_type:complete
MKLIELKKNILSKKILISLLIISVTFIIDRFCKIKIISQQEINSKIFINDYINLDLVWNTGIGFGLLNLETSLLYHLMTFFISIIICCIFFVMIGADTLSTYMYSLIAGGALGNVADRAIYFAVPDFIDIHINNFHWFTFNVADIFISVGIMILILKELGNNKKNV